MKVTELATLLVGLSAQLQKAQGEIIAKIEALEKTLDAVELPDEALDALENLRSQAQVLDDIVPDAPAE